MRAALTAGRDLTVPEIAQSTGLGRSTVAKALNRLAAAGRASRTAGTGSGVTRTPARWNPAPETTTSTGTSSGAPSTQDAPESAEAARPATERPTSQRPAARKPKRATPTGSTKTGSTRTPAPDSVVPATPTAPTRPTAATQRATTRPATAQPATDADGGEDAGTAGAAHNRVTGTVKLQPGALTQLVAGHFAAHPGTALTAGEVGRSLGRSSGAVRNACDKLVRDGDLRLDSDAPRRYALSAGTSTAS